MHLTLPRRPDVLVARPGAAVMVACAVVHIVCAARYWSSVLSLLTIAVAMVCLTCLPHLWIAPRTVDWVWVTLGSASMLTLHLMMLTQPTGHGHSHAAAITPAPDSSLDPWMVLGLILPLIGLGLAWWALGVRAAPAPPHGPGAPSGSYHG